MQKLMMQGIIFALHSYRSDRGDGVGMGC